MSVSAQDVKKLRDITGAGMMDCRKALEESSGNFDDAIEYLRKRGQKLASKRADRETKEGVVIALTSADRTSGVLIRLGCETDFVAKNESFIEIAKEFARLALKHLPQTKEDLWALQTEEGISINEKVEEQVGVIGEKLNLDRYEKISVPDGQVVEYIHSGYRAGVLLALSLKGDLYVEAGKNVAMQVAAMRPIALNKDGVDSTTVEKEIEVGKELARNEGKPEEMLEKIALGRLNKFYKESTLLAQQYVKDSKYSVEDYLKSVDKGLIATAYKHVELG